MSKSFSPSVFATLAVGAAALLSGCGIEKAPVGTVGYVKGFAGMAAADEPRAVLVARDVLSAGGTAADAAVAMYFTMAVTQPSTASLGGGGVCVVHDKQKKKTEVVEFLAPPSSQAGNARNASAVPANVRGFYALHAAHGSLRWESLLAEPERLARFGAPVSRAFAADIARAAPTLARDPAARQIFIPQGRPLAEGQEFVQPELATVISRVRRAPGEVYAGAFARELAESVTRAGGSLTPEDLRDVKPAVKPGLTVKLGDEMAHFAPPPAVAGAVAAELTVALADRWERASPQERPHLLAETAARAFAERSRWMLPHGWPNEQAAGLARPERAATLLAGYNPDRHVPVQAARPAEALPSAGMVAMDSYGNAVACNVTTHGLFGNGMVAPGTGIVLAAAPGANTGPAAIGPVLVVNRHVQEVRFAAASSGGVTAPTALAQVLLDSVVAGATLEDAVAAPRVHHSGQPDITVTESGDRTLDPAPLTRRGHEVKAAPMPSRVNAFLCRSGRAGFGNCQAVTDPRGNGLAVMVGKD